MFSFELKNHIDEIFSAYDDSSYFINTLDSIQESLPDLTRSMMVVVEYYNNNNLPNAANNLYLGLSALKNTILGLDFMDVFVQMKNLQGRLERLNSSSFSDVEQIKNITSEIQNFSIIYQSYIKSYSAADALKLVFQAKFLSNLLNGFKSGLNLLQTNLHFEDDLHGEDSNLAEISIVMDGRMSLKEFSEKLIAIDIIYTQLKIVFDLNDTTSELQVDRIEYGSLWGKFFGDSRIVALIIDLIRGSASFIYRNYTKEGQFREIPRKLETLNEVLNFTKKLQEAGVNTDECTESLQKASALIGKEMNILLSKQTNIVVNGEKQDIADGVINQLTYENAQQARIEYDAPDIENGNNTNDRNA